MNACLWFICVNDMLLCRASAAVAAALRSSSSSSALRIRTALMAELSTAASTEGTAGPMQRAITEKITANLAPVHLEVLNESYKHNVPKGSETHFKVHVVSEQFTGLSLIQRHRMVNSLLGEEFEAGLHALSIRGQTPEQFAADSQAQQTPGCLGGSKHDPVFQEKQQKNR